MQDKRSGELVGNTPRKKEKCPVFKAFINLDFRQLATADFYIISFCLGKMAF
jgi:hypothetical protein